VQTIRSIVESNPSDNNFTSLRLLAATVVIWFHSFALTLHAPEEPVFRFIAPLPDLGLLGVLAFFAISGFLVTKSFTERRAPMDFVLARVLRIYPGLIAASLFTVLVGAIYSKVPLHRFVASPITLDYLLHTPFGWELRDVLPGVFTTNPFPNAMNGSLWTLPLELKMYFGCFAAGLLSLLYRQWAFNACFAAGIAFFHFYPELFPINPGLWAARQLGLAFAAGSLIWVNSDRLPLNLPTILLAAGLLVISPHTSLFAGLFVASFTYLVLAAALYPPFRLRLPQPGDYSYGLYIYAFPVQQAIIAMWAPLHPVTLFALALPITLILAVASWHLIERPALRLKSRLGSSRVSDESKVAAAGRASAASVDR
jgi:peptidoglycan/LPS O-acetylase OafA/YrhL